MDLPPISDEFRSWIQDGLKQHAKWMVVLTDFDDFIDYVDYCDDDETLEELKRTDGEWIVNIIALDADEEQIVERVRRQWAEDEAAPSKSQYVWFAGEVMTISALEKILNDSNERENPEF